MPTRRKQGENRNAPATREPPQAIIDGLAAIEARYRQLENDASQSIESLYFGQMTDVVDLLASHFIDPDYDQLGAGELLARLRPCMEDWGPDPHVDAWRRYAWQAIGAGGGVLIAYAPFIHVGIERVASPRENNPFPAAFGDLRQCGLEEKARRDMQDFLPKVGGERVWFEAITMLLLSKNQKKANTNGKRPCFDRDQLFLKLYERDELKPAAIRDRWNKSHPDDDPVSIDVVETGIKKAKKERDGQ